MTAVLLTRPRGAEDPLATFLGEMGYRVHAVPTLATEPVPIEAASLAGFDWIVVTSAAGVAALPALPRGPSYAAFGAATAAALAERGVRPDLVPEASNGAAIAASLPDPRGRRILLARAEAAAEDLPTRLLERGAEVVELAVYRTVEAPPESRALLAAALADPDLAGVVFASGSAVRGFLGLGGAPSLRAVTIGPRTSEVARENGFEIAAEAGGQSTRELAEAVVRAFPQEVDDDV